MLPRSVVNNCFSVHSLATDSFIYPDTYSKKMLVFDGLLGITRTVKLRPRQSTCAVCGDNPTITRLIDYEVFCSSKADDKAVKLNVLDVKQRITCQQYKQEVDAGHIHLLVDVREPVEYEICCLGNSISEYTYNNQVIRKTDYACLVTLQIFPYPNWRIL